MFKTRVELRRGMPITGHAPNQFDTSKAIWLEGTTAAPYLKNLFPISPSNLRAKIYDWDALVYA